MSQIFNPRSQEAEQLNCCDFESTLGHIANSDQLGMHAETLSPKIKKRLSRIFAYISYRNRFPFCVGKYIGVL